MYIDAELLKRASRGDHSAIQAMARAAVHLVESDDAVRSWLVEALKVMGDGASPNEAFGYTDEDWPGVSPYIGWTLARHYQDMRAEGVSGQDAILALSRASGIALLRTGAVVQFFRDHPGAPPDGPEDIELVQAMELKLNERGEK